MTSYLNHTAVISFNCLQSVSVNEAVNISSTCGCTFYAIRDTVNTAYDKLRVRRNLWFIPTCCFCLLGGLRDYATAGPVSQNSRSRERRTLCLCPVHRALCTRIKYNCQLSIFLLSFVLSSFFLHVRRTASFVEHSVMNQLSALEKWAFPPSSFKWVIFCMICLI